MTLMRRDLPSEDTVMTGGFDPDDQNNEPKIEEVPDLPGMDDALYGD